MGKVKELVEGKQEEIGGDRMEGAFPIKTSPFGEDLPSRVIF